MPALGGWPVPGRAQVGTSHSNRPSLTIGDQSCTAKGQHTTAAASQPVWNADLVGRAPGHELLYELQVQGQACTGTTIPAFGQDHPQHAEELLLRHAADAVQGGCRAVGQCEQHHVIVVQHGTHPVQDGYWLSSMQVGTLATESQDWQGWAAAGQAQGNHLACSGCGGVTRVVRRRDFGAIKDG